MRRVFCYLITIFFILGLAGAVSGSDLNLISPPGLGTTSFLEEEAGIASWAQVSGVNLDMAENALKTVEAKTAEYIIGSVSLESYDESDDVHVYADTAGYVVAYYLRAEKASKIIDWKDNYVNGQITGTKVGTALQRVCNEMSLYVPEINYCDFRYPDATKMMIVTDEAIDSTETFRIKVPSEFIIYSRSWSHAINDNVGTSYYITSNIKIDTTLLNEGSSHKWAFWEGELSITQLSPNEYHEISLYDDGDGTFSAVGIVF